MRADKARTMQALRRLAERPGTPAEGEAAKRMIERLGGMIFTPRPFDHASYPLGARVFYCYWCYRNEPGTIASSRVRVEGGNAWMRIKFDRLKTARWVPVVSHLGCHIGAVPFLGDEQEALYHMDEDWFIHNEEFLEKMRKLGIDVKEAARAALKGKSSRSSK